MRTGMARIPCACLSRLSKAHKRKYADLCNGWRGLSAHSSVRERPSLFVDVDDTLYSNSRRTAQAITTAAGEYCRVELGLTYERAHELYKTYGTCLKGLEVEGIPHDRDHFLAAVHSVPLDFGHDEDLRRMLQAVDCGAVDVFIFTASIREHAQRCLEQLGVHDLAATVAKDIIDVRRVSYAAKHAPEALARAQEIAMQPSAHLCTLVDDNWTNICAAKRAGWRTVLCGGLQEDSTERESRDCADHVINTIHELPAVLPEFFHAAAIDAKWRS